MAVNKLVESRSCQESPVPSHGRDAAIVTVAAEEELATLRQGRQELSKQIEDVRQSWPRWGRKPRRRINDKTEHAVAGGKKDNPWTYGVDPLSQVEIKLLEKKQLIGPQNPDSLIAGLWLNNTRLFGMRLRLEHCSMLWGDVEETVDSQGRAVLEYSERATKTRTGASSDLFHHGPTHARSAHLEYRKRRPMTQMHPTAPFYLGINQARKCDAEVRFINSPMGKNKIGNIMSTMAEKGGFFWPKNQCKLPGTRDILLDQNDHFQLTPATRMSLAVDVFSDDIVELCEAQQSVCQDTKKKKLTLQTWHYSQNAGKLVNEEGIAPINVRWMDGEWLMVGWIPEKVKHAVEKMCGGQPESLRVLLEHAYTKQGFYVNKVELSV
ncbi:hypothetical protein Bbelb_133490 [Branchiostoma belcheri]|nr:hypothetical protein Bbelb_133490 [Branchiostoma belcheri]